MSLPDAIGLGELITFNIITMQNRLYGPMLNMILDFISGRHANVKVTKNDGQYFHANDGKRFYQFNADPSEDFVSLGIREDGDTRTVFYGYVYSPHDLYLVEQLTINPFKYR